MKFFKKNTINFFSLFRVINSFLFIFKHLLNVIIIRRTLRLLLITNTFTDVIDGFVSKNLYLETIKGAFLDPISDKTLLYIIWLFFSYKNMIVEKNIILMLYLIRDLYLTYFRLKNLINGNVWLRINSRIMGKFKTLLQFILVPTLFNRYINKTYLKLNTVRLLLYRMSILLNLLSVIQYY